MPAWHYARPGRAGVTMINIGVGPSNAKTITDHLAVLRPDLTLMIGHCAGLRNHQSIGDLVLATGYLRDDRVLDDMLPLSVPVIPNHTLNTLLLSELTARGLPSRMGIVFTTADRNWELNLATVEDGLRASRAVAVDMESATVAANGFRYRIPAATLLAVSDKPLHAAPKLSADAQGFYAASRRQHVEIAISVAERVRKLYPGGLPTADLRSPDEPLLGNTSTPPPADHAGEKTPPSTGGLAPSSPAAATDTVKGMARESTDITTLNRAAPAAVAPVMLDDVTKRYGRGRGSVTALDRVSLSFAAGSFTAVLGVSGSGKSTLLQCAAGLERPSSGAVRLCGQELSRLSQRKQAVLRRQRVGFVFQELNLLPELTVAENIALPLRLDRRRARRADIEQAAARVGLSGRPAPAAAGRAVRRPAAAGGDCPRADYPPGRDLRRRAHRGAWTRTPRPGCCACCGRPPTGRPW